MADLVVAKNNLFTALGDKSNDYLNLLKLWFRGSMDKDAFDEKVHKTLSATEFKLHNKFLVCLFNRCHALAGAKDTGNLLTKSKPATLTSTLKKLKLPKVPKDQGHHFFPSSSAEVLAPIDVATSDSEKYHNSVLKMSLCSSESALPDNFSAHLRMYVNVWEAGLENLDDDAVKLMNIATRVFVKDILTAIFSYKSSYRTVEGSNFKYAFGAPPINPFLSNSLSFLKYPLESQSAHFEDSAYFHSELISDPETAEREAVFQVACSTPILEDKANCDIWPYHHTVTLEHVFNALKMYKNCVSNSMSVYMLGMDRIMSRLNE